MKRAGRKCGGFTLVEMLVAVSLLGLLGVISWRGLDQVVALRDRVNEETVDIERVVRTIAQIERDIDVSIADVLMAAPPVNSPLPHAINISTDRNRDNRVSLFRTRPESPGAQTVAYFVRSEELVRSVSIEDEDTTTSVTMLGDVREFRVRLLLSGNWVAPNELDETVTGRAQAIEVAIERAGGERYLRILPL
jgi:general secretion pathway protein J